MKNRNITESYSLEEAIGASGIDEANGILKNVVLLTGMKASANKNFYTKAALEEAAPRYEGAKMFIDHPREGDRGRSIRDFGGVYRNTRVENDKVIGDLHLTESARPIVLPIAKMKPKGVGLSIKDRGRGQERDGVFLVEGFVPNIPYSIDFVADPSANKGLFESNQNGGPQATDEEEDVNWKEITAEEVAKNRPDLVESIRNEGKASVLKELDEAKKKGEDGDKATLKANKLVALVEAKFEPELNEAVRKMIEPESISLDAAKGIISGQKEMLEAMKKKVTNGDPKVIGAGARQTELTEGQLPTESDIISAFRG